VVLSQQPRGRKLQTIRLFAQFEMLPGNKSAAQWPQRHIMLRKRCAPSESSTRTAVI
jgi:hypothetical protein